MSKLIDMFVTGGQSQKEKYRIESIKKMKDDVRKWLTPHRGKHVEDVPTIEIGLNDYDVTEAMVKQYFIDEGFENSNVETVILNGGQYCLIDLDAGEKFDREE